MVLTFKTVVWFLKWLFLCVIGTEKAKRSEKISIQKIGKKCFSFKRLYQKLFFIYEWKQLCFILQNLLDFDLNLYYISKNINKQKEQHYGFFCIGKLSILYWWVVALKLSKIKIQYDLTNILEFQCFAFYL